MGAYTKFYIKPAEGEQIETVVRLGTDRRSMLRGSVLDEGGKPIADACVAVFNTAGKESLRDYIPVDITYTDPDGGFLAGPLSPDTLYAVYVYKNGIKIRQLELRG